MAFSTGVSLLPVGNFFLKEQLAEFWEFVSGTGTGHLSGTSTGSGVGLGVTSGVNGVANDALQIDTAWNPTRSWLNVGTPYHTTGSTETFCFFATVDSNICLRWGSTLGGSSGTNTLGILFQLSSGILFRETEGGATSNIQSALATNSTAANNSYRFYCITREGKGSSSNTFSFYDSDGNLLGKRTIDATGANTVNFGLIESGMTSSSFISKMDKVAWFNGQLLPSQINYLFNSGNGRSGSDIMSATI
jgi:hypothetical protein